MNQIQRRKWLGMALASAVLPRVATAQQPWPAKPVRLVTAFGAGSASDIVARMIAEDLQAAFGQAFVVDNKPGASGILATDFVAKAPPDGYTILLATNTTHSVNPFMFRKLPYDPVRDFTPIARICYFPFVLLVNAESGIKSVAGLRQYAQANPGKVRYGYGNSTGQIASAALDTLTKLGATAVPYKSSPQVLVDLIGGQITYAFGDLASSAAHLKSGRVHALAVSTEQSSALAPDLPPLASAASLPGFDLAAWVGIFGPHGLPPEITQKLSARINQMLARKDVADKLAAMGAELAAAPAPEFASYVRRQLDVWGAKVKAANIQPE